MVGYKSEESYINRYGEDEGKIKYKNAVNKRKVREAAILAGTRKKENIVYTEEDVTSGNAIKCMACGLLTSRLQWTHFKNKCSINTLEEYKIKYPDSEMIAPSVRKKQGITLEKMIALYGEENGTIKWNEYCSRQAETNTFEYKLATYGWSKEEFDAYNKSRAVTLPNLIKRHGNKKANIIWKQYCEAQRYTNTLEYFIEREGSEEKGKEAYLNYNKEKGKSSDPYWIMENMEISFDDALQVLSKRKNNLQFVSEGEKQFVDMLDNSLSENIKYTYKTRQFCIWSDELKTPLFYDICCSKKKLIIEYNGDYWHANPNVYNEDFSVKQSNMTAAEIWERDRLKELAATRRGFIVIKIWESDFLSNKEEVIDKVRNIYESL